MVTMTIVMLKFIMISNSDAKIHNDKCLVGGLEHFLNIYFPFNWGHVIIPTDFHSMIFQWGKSDIPLVN